MFTFSGLRSTLVWKPNPPLRSVCCAHLRARADAPSESTMGASCSRSAYAPLLRCLCLRVRCETGVNQALLKSSRWKRLSSRDQWNLSPATMCCGWQRALYEEQHRPCTSTSATTSNFYSHTLKKWLQMRPFWSQSRALQSLLENLFVAVSFDIVAGRHK